VEFTTSFFDDRLKVQVYQNNSTSKANLVGKAIINLRDLEFNTAMHATGEPPIYPLTVVSRRGQFAAGTLFLHVTYSAINKNLLYSDWS
jgi:Ca2+-dependent lipid-binding protein